MLFPGYNEKSVVGMISYTEGVYQANYQFYHMANSIVTVVKIYLYHTMSSVIDLIGQKVWV